MDRKLKVAIYTIAKNEANLVKRWADSNKDADYRLVCDTGSTDETVELLRQEGITVFSIVVNPWRFDTARNAALNLLPEDIDVCIWQDIDEVLLDGWRDELEKKWEVDATIANHRYRHNDMPWTWHSKIHTRKNCYWRGAVHEGLSWTTNQKAIWIDSIFLHEQQDTTKSRGSYLELLLLKIEEGEKDWKTFYFLADEYFKRNNLEECIKWKSKSYDVCEEEGAVKAYIARNIGLNYLHFLLHDEAIHWLSLATRLYSGRESWFNLAKAFYTVRDWEQCYLASKKCVAVEIKNDGFVYDREAWGFSAYDLAALSAYQLGMYPQAVEFGKKAIELNPDDDRLKENLKFYEMRL